MEHIFDQTTIVAETPEAKETDASLAARSSDVEQPGKNSRLEKLRIGDGRTSAAVRQISFESGALFENKARENGTFNKSAGGIL